MSKFCHSNYLCFQCNEKHHISICNKKQTQTSATLVSVSDRILLQTTKAKFFNNSENVGYSEYYLTVVNIQNIIGQRSNVTEDVCKRLKLKTIRREDIIIKTFGQLINSIVKKLGIVQLKVKHKNANLYVYVEVLSVTVIFSPVQRLELVKNFPHISKLFLADFADDSKIFLLTY